MITKVLEPSEVTSDYSFKKFEKDLDEYNEQLVTIANPEDLKRFILSGFSELSNFYITASNTELLEEFSKKEKSPDRYLLHYALSKPFKDLMLLHRDVLLQLQIAAHKEEELVVSKEARATHFLESKSILQQAFEAFRKSIEQEY